MGDKELYEAAVDSVKRYKGSGEKLTDFDDFINEIKREYNTRTYKVILTPANQGYMVTVPDFKCNTQGKDMDEALFMAKDVIELMAASLKDIPKPDSVDFIASPDDIIKYIKVDL